ncbi:MAG: hypothetical protein WC860_07075 [Candidatus Margulisiibacteriota bacterium]|jgi:hypothetical protein
MNIAVNYFNTYSATKEKKEYDIDHFDKDLIVLKKRIGWAVEKTLKNRKTETNNDRKY